MPDGLCDLSSLTRDRIPAPTVKTPSPNHWNSREFLLPVSSSLGVGNVILSVSLYSFGQAVMELRFKGGDIDSTFRPETCQKF